MKAGKIILGMALITIISFTSFNLFISSDYEFERSIEIDAPVDSVYKQVTDLSNWKNWFVWLAQDTSLNIIFSGESSGTGSKMEWTDLAGQKGSIEILSANLESITTALNFGNRTQNGFFKFKDIKDGTKVIWRLQGEMPFFVRFMTLFIDKMAGPEYERGLKKLKEVCEE